MAPRVRHLKITLNLILKFCKWVICDFFILFLRCAAVYFCVAPQSIFEPHAYF